MTTDTERRLRAALEASADLITEPGESADYQPPTDQPDYAARSNTPRRRLRGRWAGPLLAAAAVVVAAAVPTAVLRTVHTHQAQPVAHRSPAPVASAPSPVASAPSPTPSAGRQPLVGPGVIDAELFAGGHGYARTQHSLLWTDDLGATWRTITPPDLSEAQLQTAGIAVRPDGHAWVAVPPKAGSRTITVLRRSATSRTWTSTSIPLGPLTISPDASVTTSLSFPDADTGWLMITEDVTHQLWGEVLRTTDGGATWTLQAGQRSLPVAGAIHFLTATIGYLDANSSMGSRGWWATSDAGRTWTQLRLPTPAAKKSDSVSIISAPTLVGDSIVVAASFTTAAQGTDDGVGIYRSTNGGASWTVQLLASEAASERYSFAATADGSAYVLLRSQPSQDLQTFTWVTSRSTNRGQSFTDTSSVHNYYPGPLTLADPGHLWALGGANGCTSFKTDCSTSAALIASHDGGATWRPVRLPS